jgi:hypothetical protein
MHNSLLIKGIKKISFVLVAAGLLFALVSSSGCSSLKRNNCGCPNKKGLGGF